MDYIYRADVLKHKVRQPDTKIVTLFGKEVRVYDDAWRNHLHVIPTYRCNAKCDFCIEKDSKCEEIEDFFGAFFKTCCEMAHAGILHTVSFTGGEPSLYKDLQDLVSVLPGKIFKTINTNGTNIEKVLKMGFNWVNLSQHYINYEKNDKVFGFSTVDLSKLMNMERHPNTKIRLQAVVNEDTRLKDYLGMIHLGICDDVSFRSIMLDGSKSAKYYHDMYLNLIDEALNMGSKVIEQEIQDYYVYEVHEINGKNITFSYSNMEHALAEDHKDKDLIREFILRPDGSLSGSWDLDVKVIK